MRKGRIGTGEPKLAGPQAPRGFRSYLPLLRRLHRRLDPRTYVEIGVASGRSLVRARTGTLCIGIDPAPTLRRSIPASARIFELTSDEFFARHDLRALLHGLPVDLAFIDGMHLFEFVLRDFVRLERACARGSVITVHDCDPPSEEAAARDRRGAFWTGDVWKLVVCLRKYRPDLEVAVVDVPPSGLGIVTNLDPASAVLEERYEEICEEFVDLPYSHLGSSKRERLNVVPSSWEVVEGLLPVPGERDRGDRGPARPAGASVAPLSLAPKRTPRPARERQPDEERLAPRQLRVGSAASGQIALCGYSERMLEQVREAARDLDVRSGRPPIHRFRDLTFVPKFAALYDEEGRRVLETCVRRGPGLADVHHRPPEAIERPGRARRVKRPVIYCGRLRAHWGHFLTETISRLWALADPEAPPGAALLFQDYPRDAVGFVNQFLRHAGIKRKRMLDVDSVTTFSEVFVPHPSFSLGGQAFHCHIRLPERVAEVICDDVGHQTDQPVYLSRRLAPKREGRWSQGEEELEEALRHRGVRIAYPETLSYEDQVRLFNRHSTFIGPIGSAFHSLLYARPGRRRRTVVIADAVSYYDPGHYPDYFMIDALKGVHSTYLFAPTDSPHRLGAPSLGADETIAFLERLSVI